MATKTINMNIPIKKPWIIAILIFLLLCILNPSYSDFKAYSGSSKKARRTTNLLILSKYEQDNEAYLGFLKNFIRISKPKVEPPTDSTGPAPILIESPTKVLYDSLISFQLYSKSYEEFQLQYNNIISIDRLYSGLHGDSLYRKSRGDFYAQFFPQFTNAIK